VKVAKVKRDENELPFSESHAELMHWFRRPAASNRSLKQTLAIDMCAGLS